MTQVTDIFPVSLDIAPMEAKSAARLPNDAGWQYEPKWDGFRCLAFKSDNIVELRAKSGKSLTRYFPDVIAALKEIEIDRFVVDGELAIPMGDTLSFEALQMRLHPAESRVRKLAAESPAVLILFDCLADADGFSLISGPLRGRRLSGYLQRPIAQLSGSHRLRASLGKHSDGWIVWAERSTVSSPRS
jgi:ATP-dependent DNA ligase